MSDEFKCHKSRAIPTFQQKNPHILIPKLTHGWNSIMNIACTLKDNLDALGRKFLSRTSPVSLSVYWTEAQKGQVRTLISALIFQGGNIQISLLTKNLLGGTIGCDGTAASWALLVAFQPNIHTWSTEYMMVCTHNWLLHLKECNICMSIISNLMYMKCKLQASEPIRYRIMLNSSICLNKRAPLYFVSQQSSII